MDLEQKFSYIYQDYDKYIAIPLAMIVFSFVALGANYILTGEFMQKGTDFTGGSEIQISIEGEINPQEIEEAFLQSETIEVSEANVVIEKTSQQDYALVRIPPEANGEVFDDENRAEQVLEEAGISGSVESLQAISATVSDQFFKQAGIAFVFAFTIMSLVIFIAFKDLTPSVAVIFAAAGDILFAIAGMIVFQIPLTLGSLAALLMLIGYSVDTDIVLSSRALKEKRGSLEERIWGSVKTGITMSSGGIAAFTILYIVSTTMVGQSELSNIAAVMVIGLLADIPFTYFGNTIILKKYINQTLPLVDKINKVTPWN